MRRVAFLAAAMVILAAASAAQAATISVTNSGNTWVPATFHASVGDTISWSISSGAHNVVTYAGNESFTSTTLGPSGAPYTRTFGGGQVWYSCTIHSSFTSSGVCTGMCGSYTDRTTAPTAPTISSPAPGSSVGANPYTVSGTAQPWMLVKVLQNGAEIGRGHAGPSGAWSALATSPASGSVTIRAVAVDAEGRASADSNAVTFTLTATAPDGQLPTITVTTPNASVFVTDPVIQGTARDNVSVAAVTVEVYNLLNQRTIFTAACPCPSGAGITIPWSATLTNLLPGVYAVRAIARDTSNLARAAPDITIIYV